MDSFSVGHLMDVYVILISVTFCIYVICWASIYEYTCFNYSKLLFQDQKEISDYLTIGLLTADFVHTGNCFFHLFMYDNSLDNYIPLQR